MRKTNTELIIAREALYDSLTSGKLSVQEARDLSDKLDTINEELRRRRLE